MIPGIFNNPAASKMGWAVLHLLWQGTLIALALKGALILIEQRSAPLRYVLALACLFLMAALPVFLLCRPQRSRPEIPAALENVQFETAASPAGSVSGAIPIPGKMDIRTRVSDFVTPVVPWIAAGWLLGMMLLLLKTIGGVVQVRGLRREAHGETEGTASFRRLAARAGVGEVPVLESGLVSAPTVAGWFRPVVLLPEGALGKIGRPMVEALVTHEFAHIRRHDSLMNLLQTVAEDLLFFHPAVWWVTGNVRAEREACCDDDAVAACGDPLLYARALSQAEQFRSSMPVTAVSSSPLLHRIRRLTEMKTSKINRVAAFCLSLFAVSFVIGTAAGSGLLATIPPQASKASVSADRDSGKGRPEAQVTGAASRNSEARYFLLCGIVFGTFDKPAGKPIVFPPPPPKGKPIQPSCFLFDHSTPQPSSVPGELQASRLIYKTDAVYPEAAIREHVGIRVVLRINLDEKGSVTTAEVTKSQTVPPDRDSKGNWVGGVRAGVVKEVNRAAVNAVKQWKYSPTLLNGKAIPVATTVSVTFTFDSAGSPRITIFPNA